MKLLKEVSLRDVLFVAGFGCLVYGIALLHVPAAWIVAGGLLMAAGWRLAE
jgi:hypothetical protein